MNLIIQFIDLNFLSHDVIKIQKSWIFKEQIMYLEKPELKPKYRNGIKT